MLLALLFSSFMLLRKGRRLPAPAFSYFVIRFRWMCIGSHWYISMVASGYRSLPRRILGHNKLQHGESRSPSKALRLHDRWTPFLTLSEGLCRLCMRGLEPLHCSHVANYFKLEPGFNRTPLPPGEYGNRTRDRKSPCHPPEVRSAVGRLL